MKKSYVTNNHFRSVLNELGNYLDKGQEPPEDLFSEFVSELRVSNLLVPGIIDGDEFISENLTSNEDGTTIIPLYTDDDEYLKDKGMDADEFEPIPNDIRYYVELLNENSGDGLIINLASECFSIPTPLLNDLPLNQGISFQDNFKGYGPDRLINIAKNATNDSFIDFIRNSNDFNNIERLMLEFSKSTLLNVIVSDENLEYYAKEGIIFYEDVGGFELCTSRDEGGEYGILFTSTDAITSTMDEDNEFYYYYQIAVLSEFIDHILRSDMRGIIINPGLDDYLIPRTILFDYSSFLDNPSFKQAINYAFLL